MWRCVTGTLTTPCVTTVGMSWMPVSCAHSSTGACQVRAAITGMLVHDSERALINALVVKSVVYERLV